MLKGKTIVLLAAAAMIAAGSLAQAAPLAGWTFETSLPATAGPFSPEVGSGSALGLHAGAAVYSTPAGNGSSHSFSSNTWAIGDYYQFSTSTLGFSNIAISWDQTSSNTGPKDFKLAWSTDGTIFTDLQSYAVLPNGGAPNASWNVNTSSSAYSFGPIAGPAILDNQPNVYFRLIVTSTVSANGGTLAAGGTDRVDNVTITPEPASLVLLAAAGAMFWRRRR